MKPEFQQSPDALQQIYVHLNSLLNWNKLVSKTMQKDTKTSPQAAKN